MITHDVRLVIASFGRPKTQITIRNLPEALQRRVELMVVPSQLKQYKAERLPVRSITCWPDDVDTIYKKRLVLSNTMKDPFLLLDDDLQLMYWSSSAGRFITATSNPDMFVKRFDRGLLPLFKEYDMVSCAGKFMADQYVKSKGVLKTGIPGFVVSGYNPGVCSDVDFTRTSVLSDMNQGIQALQLGKTSATYFGIVFSQSSAKSLVTSGCGAYRTNFMKIDAALRFLQYYKGLVTNFKATKTENGGGLQLVKRLSRLTSGVKESHILESRKNLHDWVSKLGLSSVPKRPRWTLEEPVDEFVNRLKASWTAAGFHGDFDNISLGIEK